jgi:hypothetical protein
MRTKSFLHVSLCTSQPSKQQHKNINICAGNGQQHQASNENDVHHHTSIVIAFKTSFFKISNLKFGFLNLVPVPVVLLRVPVETDKRKRRKARNMHY